MFDRPLKSFGLYSAAWVVCVWELQACENGVELNVGGAWAQALRPAWSWELTVVFLRTPFKNNGTHLLCKHKEYFFSYTVDFSYTVMETKIAWEALTDQIIVDDRTYGGF